MNVPKQPTPPLAHFEAELAKKSDQFRQATERYDAARRDETAARNALNEAQKNFDAKVEELRKEAPRDSAWFSRRGSKGASG